MPVRIVFATLIATLAGVLAALMATAAGPTSEEIADRLAEAIRFETVSPEDPADFRGEPFDRLEAYLREAYPGVFAALSLEHVNGYMLLLRWEGSDDTLPPAPFMSHTDVVPVSEAAAEKWSQPPYGGVVSEGYVWGAGRSTSRSGSSSGWRRSRSYSPRA